MQSSNFDFLKEHDPVFFQLASSAERSFSSDPNTTLIKLRQLGEAIAQDVSARCGIVFDEQTTQADLLYKMNREIRLDETIRQLFHTLRIEGNKATHQFRTRHKDALDGLKIARSIAVWFHQSFGKKGAQFRPGPFVEPQDPSLQLRELQIQIEQLKCRLSETHEQLETSQKLKELTEREKEEHARLADLMKEEARVYETLAQEQENIVARQQKEFEEKLKAMQAELDNRQQAARIVTEQTQKASAGFTLTEELTRILIDQQLIEAGWETDTQELTYKKGARPESGKNKAISEWPTHKGQRADYVLFAGLVPIAIVEAKRENINVSDKIGQAERYARGFRPTDAMKPAWAVAGQTIAWPDDEDGHYHIPFVYSCNGRPYVKQLAEQSGTWFRDVREPFNLSRPLQRFHSPEGLLDKLKRSREAAEAELRKEGFDYLKLRDYQEQAIVAVEAALSENQPHCLLAMATGTGKTRTIMGLMYRFLKTERFKRILFLVDRRTLGGQATDVFTDVVIEQNLTLSKIYTIAELGDMAAEAETRIQVATVQAMVRRVFQSDTPPMVDAFDCIIVDEAHRGYTLDQEMTEGELAMRDQAQYLSSYRRVLDYFDAFKVGLTATPARHTTEIFGRPVFTYSYREAVADDWLIDHEPPIRYKTLLSEHGIHFDKGETVNVVNLKTGQVESADLEDEQDFDIDTFNKRVITENFNKVICEQLAQELDPFGDEKTLIFCATDLHADMVKRLLDEEFNAVYGEQYNEASVRKITGQSDKVDTLIKKYKNERYPTIAITVDLLTTGVDVHRICHLVFLRRVKSRILYEQMIGRATRRCDDIGKTVFKIYDPVDIYATLEKVCTMKPLVKDPGVTLAQLVSELLDPRSLSAPGNRPGTTHAHDVLDAVSQKIMRVLRKAVTKAERQPDLKQKLDELEGLWGVSPANLHQHLRSLGPEQAAAFITTHSRMLDQLNSVNDLIGTEHFPIISNHHDQILERIQSYGNYERPQDYLDGFNQFIRTHINASAALSVVVNRPRDLTREQLKEIRLLLDQNGFSEASLKSAWRNQTNHDIAASIIGFIRQAALGEALIPFEQRVANAMTSIYALRPWTQVQRKWLERLSKQLVHEVVIDQAFVNKAFARDGGAKNLDKILGHQLETVLEALAESLWSAAG